MGSTTLQMRKALALVFKGASVKEAAKKCRVTTGAIYRHAEYKKFKGNV